MSLQITERDWRDARELIWFISSIWFNQTNQTDRTDQMNKTGWRTFSASC